MLILMKTVLKASMIDMKCWVLELLVKFIDVKQSKEKKNMLLKLLI